MTPAQDKNETPMLLVAEAAAYLGISANTMRRWDARGIISPIRTPGGQRRYTKNQLISFLENRKKDLIPESFVAQVQERITPLQTPSNNPTASVHASFGNQVLALQKHPSYRFKKNAFVLVEESFASLPGFSKSVVVGFLCFLTFVSSASGTLYIGLQMHALQLPKNIFSTKKTTTSVLAAETEKLLQAGSVLFNIPATFIKPVTFKDNVKIEDKDLDLGTGNITASNILYGIKAGAGLSVSGGQTPTLTNSDTGSAQKIFGKIKLGNDTISAGSNTDTFTLSAGSNISLSADTSAKSIKISNSLSIPDVGWTLSSTTVSLSTSTNSVGVGTTSPTSKFSVGSSSEFQVNSTGNLIKVNNITYSWPTANATAANYVLSSDTSGNLTWSAVAGVGGVSGTGSSGQITFWNGTSTVTGSNNFFWDNTNNRLGIKNSSPSYTLDLATTTASDRGINIANTAATGTNYGVYSSVTGAATTNYGGYFVSTGATTNYGLAVAALTGVTSTGLDIGALSGTTADKGINIGAISGSGATGAGITVGNISTTGTTNYGINLGTLTGGTTSNYQIQTGNITSIASATNAGLVIGTTKATTGTAASSTNYGINIFAMDSTGTINTALNIGALSGATTTKGLAIGALSGATSTGVDIGALSGTTANTGVTVGAISGTGTGTGLSIGAISSTGTTNKGIDIGNISGATSNNYGINIGTLTGGSGSSVYGINTGTLTSVASGTNYQANLGAVVGASSATFGAITTGAISGAGTTSYGINLGANTSTATTNYGINIGAISGAGTTNYGLYVGSISGATTNYGGVFAGTWFTGGSATTTKPQLLIEPSGTTSTNWSTSGTGLGINAATTFAGNLIDVQQNAVSLFKLVSASSAVNGFSLTATATGGAPTIAAAGSDTNIALTINSKATGALTLDSGTTGNVNLGTGSNAKTITIGNGTSTTALALTSGTGSQTFTSSVVSGTTTTSAFVYNDTALTIGTLSYLTSNSITTGKLLDIADSNNTWTGNGTTNGLINLSSASTAGTGSSSSILLNLARSGTNTNSSHTAYGVYSAVSDTGTTSVNVAGYFSATGATTNRGLEVAAMTGATSTGLTIGALSGTTADTGISIGALSGSGATNTGITIGNISGTGTSDYGIQLGTLTGGTTSNYQISTGVLTSATTTTNAQINLGGVVTTGGTTNYGINVGALSGTGTTNYGINIATLTSTGTTSTALNIGGLSGAATTNNGIAIGAISGNTTTSNGISLSTLTGGASSTTLNQIATGTLTASATSSTDYQLNLGAVVGTTTSTFGAIATGAISGAGTTSYGINLGANSSTATTNYGVNVGAISGAGTNNYGLNIAGVSGSTNNYAIATAQGQVSLTDTSNTAASLVVTNNTVTTLGAGVTTNGMINFQSTSLTTGNLINGQVAANTLTTGTLLNLSTTSTALAGTATTGQGMLGNFDWTPGSSTTATGDLFRIHLGANALVSGNVFDIVNNTSSIFAVNPQQLTTSIPASFTAAGDVSIAYDINFTNPTSSFLKSQAPITLQAGETFNSSNLTLATFNQGTVVFSSAASTGTSLDYTNASLTTGTGFNFQIDGLTTGKGININSTATGVTTGSLLNISTGTTGVVATNGIVSINATGAYTSTSNAGLLNLNASGTTAGTVENLSAAALTTGVGLNISTAALTTGQTLSITAGGATALTSGQGLLITGPTGAAAISANSGLVKITAAGALTTQTGAGSGGLLDVQDNAIITGTLTSISDTAIMTGNGNLLTLTANAATTTTGLLTINGTGLTAGTGNAIYVNSPGAIKGSNVVTGGNSNSPSLTLEGNGFTAGPTNTTGSFSVQSQPASATSAKLMLSVTGWVTTANLYSWDQAGNVISKGTDTNSSTPDLAENVPVSDQTIEAGDVVSVEPNAKGDGSTYDNFKAKKSSSAYDHTVLGVISTNPGVILHAPADAVETGQRSATTDRPLTIAGRTPVKVSTENGSIQSGDYLTASSTPGVAMKAITAGVMIGKALENYSATVVGQVLVLVNVGWYDPGVYMTDNGTLAQNTVSQQPTSPTPADQTASSSAQPTYTLTTDLLYVSLNNQVSALSSKVNLLQDLVSQQASLSASFLQTATTSAILVQNVNLDAQTATVSGTLTVLDRTTLSDVGITGTLNAGLLTIKGLDDSIATPGASINTLSGPLMLQSNGMNGIDIANGKVTVDKDGNIQVAGNATFAKDVTVTGVLSAQAIQVTKDDFQDISSTESIASSSAGTAFIKSGQTIRKIDSILVKTDSLIYITPLSDTNNQTIYISEQKDGKYFIVSLKNPLASDAKFNFLIVNYKQ